MRVATLQFDPRLGRVEANAKCATEILSNTDDLHNVVGPEMALSGESDVGHLLRQITEFPEHLGNGMSNLEWGRKRGRLKPLKP